MAVHEPTLTRVGMPMDEFLRLATNNQPLEVVDGKIVWLTPHVAGQSEIIHFIMRHLFDIETTLPVEWFANQTYVQLDTDGFVINARIPDVSFYQSERIEQYKAQTLNWRELPYILVPDLCIEVVSPTDKFTEVETKVRRYLADGVRIIWVIDSGSRSAFIYTADSKQRTQLGEDDLLDGGALVPDFSVRVGDILDA